MTTEEFNELPLDARQYIERQQQTLCCGRANDLDAHYKNYLAMKNEKLYTLRLGAVAYKDGNKSAVLYPISPADTEDQIKGKLAQAKVVYAKAPDKFDNFNESAIDKILGAKAAPAAKAAPTKTGDVPTDKNGKPLTGAPLKAAEAKAAKATPVVTEEAKKEDETVKGDDSDKEDEDPLK